MQLKLNKYLRAFCPRMHFNDIDIKDPEKHGIKTGATITVRILSVDPKLKKVICTYKKTLVKSDLPIISSYEVEADALAHGVIVAFKPFGCIVLFYNSVKGVVGASDLGTHVTMENIRKSYKTGQVVKCRVVSANQFAEKLRLSFNVRIDFYTVRVQNLTYHVSRVLAYTKYVS